MAIQTSAEDYLETIYNLHKKIGNVRSIDIAHELNYSKPSISRAMKNLKESGCITINELGHIFLTSKGLEIAKAITERHEVLMHGLMALGVNEKIAHEDACKMEHILSEESYEAIKKMINKNRVESRK